MNTVQKLCFEVGAGVAIGVGISEGLQALLNLNANEIYHVKRCANYLGETSLTAAGLDKNCHEYIDQFTAASTSVQPNKTATITIHPPSKQQFITDHLRRAEAGVAGSERLDREINDPLWGIFGGGIALYINRNRAKRNSKK